MAPWTERLVALATVVIVAAASLGGATPQTQAPAPRVVLGRAILLEDGEFFRDASTDEPSVASYPAGTVFDFLGETTDAFGRVWYTVSDPDRLEKHRGLYLTNLDRRGFAEFGYLAAVLADRVPGVAGAPPRPVGGIAPPPPPPWWTPAAVVGPQHDTYFDAVLAISARAPDEGHLEEAIEILGGREALGDWPRRPLPGELFVPVALPALFQFDGDEWRLARPVRMFGDSLNLLGNPEFVVDPTAPLLAGGPPIECWQLIGALDPGGIQAGSAAIAPPPVVGARGGSRAGAEPTAGGPGGSPSGGPPLRIAQMMQLSPALRVPPRVDPPPAAVGIVIEDAHSLQAVYLQQMLGPELTHRLRGRSLVLDVYGRNPPRATAAASFGVDVEIVLADGSRAETVPTSGTTAEQAARFEYTFEVPADAETITIRLLPADRSVARELRGSVVFERAALRLAHWRPASTSATVILYRIATTALEGAALHTRAPVAVTERDPREVRRAWPDVQAADWSDEIKELVLAGEIDRGMTEEQVRLAWGEPVTITPPDAGGNVHRWQYEDRYAAFADGRVIAFLGSSPEEPPAAPAFRCPSGFDPAAIDAGR